MKYSQGFHPLPRIIFHEALSVGIESMEESANLELNNKINPDKIISKVNPHLPEGIIINSVKNIDLKKLGLADSDKNKKYLIYLQQNNDAAEKIKDFLSKEDLIITLVSKKKSYTIDIKEAVDKITIDENNILEIVTRNTQKKSPKITKIIETILQIDEKETAALQIIKTTT
jgi:radical SAM-linked protein